MELEELEINLNELDTRVDRVRALYEQYFMGIEKLEPTVLRKDIDRRFWILRREQIRNTAMRFKLNTISQRYNTYQQYWARILREMDQGTYRRHVRKAEQRFGKEALTIASRRRRGAKVDGEQETQATEAAEKAERALAQVPDIDAYEVEVDFAELAELDGIDDLLPPREAPRAAPVRARPAAALDELDDLESLMGLSARPARAAQPAPARTAPARPVRRDVEDAFGDIGGVFAEDEEDQTQPRHVPRFSAPAQQHTPPRPAAPQTSARPQPPGPVARPQPPQPAARPQPPQPAARPQPPQPAARPQPPQPAARPQPPQPAARPQPPQPAARPQPPQPAARPQPPQPAARPQPPQAPAAATPRGAAPPAAAAPQPRQSAIGRSSRTAPDALSDDRVRQIYRDYVQAKRNCNESTSSITEDALASTLRTSAEKLRNKHKGKQVDFDVVIKEGKAVLKPVVKS